MGKLCRLDASGHGAAVEWDERATTREVAERVFREYQRSGYDLFRPGKRDGDGALLKNFDPDAEEIIAVRRMVAG